MKMGGLGNGPARKMGGGYLSERPLTGKTGDFGAKNNKETFFFFLNESLLDLLRPWVFWSGPGRKRRGFRKGQGRKWGGGGGFRAAHTRIVLIWG